MKLRHCMPHKKEEKEFEIVNNTIVLSENSRTYSLNIFHVDSFDVFKSHCLRLLNAMHNESQDGNTELCSAFYHFKQ